MKIPLRAIILLAALAGTDLAAQAGDQVFARFAAEVEAAYPGTPTISAAAFLLREDRARFIVLDARSPAEIAVSRIPGAITRGQLPVAADDRPVLVYCTIGMRSARTTRELRAAGYDASNLAGGILAWAAAGGELVDAAGAPTRKVHTYGARWNHLPPGFDPVW